MPKSEKIFTIEMKQDRRDYSSKNSGTLSELIKYHSYTLECGQSWEHEKGNKKINRNPKSVATLVKNLNNAVNNSAANGYAGKHYSLFA